MHIRKTFIPKQLIDIVCSGLLIFVLIPYVYWFELFVVVPHFFNYWSFWYLFHWILGTYIGLNILTNLVALILCDTSIKGRTLPTILKPDWKFCSICECVVPPRSWHCDNCNTCILKRDHHCLFSGCCVGHDNYRYFFMLMAYLFIALVYSTILNCNFIWDTIDFKKLYWINFVFPLAIFLLKYIYLEDYDLFQQWNLLVFLLLALATCFVTFLFIYHIIIVKTGQSMYEKANGIDIYNMGLLENIRSVFGLRWYVAWICPFINSTLPQDGVHWETTKTKGQ